MTTYTIERTDGQVERGLTLEQAADAIMTYDGHEYEVRRDRDGLTLWVSQFSRNSTLGGRPLVKSVIRAASHDDLYRAVLKKAEWWNGQTAYTDEAYDVLLTELKAQDE